MLVMAYCSIMKAYSGETFVTRKITMALCRIKLGIQKCLFLGNLDAKRDWGHAKDFVEMQWLMLQQDKARDYVISTGVQYSVRDFVDKAAKFLDISLKWYGSGLDEYAVDQLGNTVVAVDPLYFRPSEVQTLLGDSTLASSELGWSPRLSFDDLVQEMVESDMLLAKKNIAQMNITV